MAADQKRKRMNSANVIGFSSREHYRAKRKKLAGDHISLEWDSSRSKVVSKRDQVGLSSRHLRSFVDFAPPRRNILAQVCPIPQETYQLENLSEVLSVEVWRECLSDGERDYLRKFLPEGVDDVEKVVQGLLDGENFHFGNPFLDWGKDVCSSKGHPDQIVSREERMSAVKRRYYSDLEKYHYDMIDYLQMLKEKWESCKDSEKDEVMKMWGRSRGSGEHVTGSSQDLSDASESSSSKSDDDNKISSPAQTREVNRRLKSSAIEKEKSQSPLIAQDNVVVAGGKARKKDKIPKCNIQRTDGSKYMSYVKISKKQYQIVTSMKQSGKSIQSKALNKILGDIKDLNVQPYGLFVEEEQKKLNAHWLQLVKDLPAAHAIWEKLQVHKRDIINSVERELKDKLNPWMEDEQQMPLEESLDPSQNGYLAPDVEDSGKNHSPSKESSSHGDQIIDSGRCVQVVTYPSQVSSPVCDNDINLEDTEERRYCSPRSPNTFHGLEGTDVEENGCSSSMQSHSLPHASFLSEPHGNANPVGKHYMPVLENALPEERIPCIASNNGEESQFFSGGDEWKPVGGIRQSYIGSEAYTTPSVGLSMIHHPEGNEDEKNHFIDLKSDLTEEVDRTNMLQGKSNNSFGSYPNNDQIELIQSLLNGQDVASHKTKQLNQIMSNGFQRDGSNNLLDVSQFQGQMNAPYALSQQRQVDVYSQGSSMPDNVYSDGRGFLMQRPDWNTTQHPRLSTDPLLTQNWQQYKNMWGNTNGGGYASQDNQMGTERNQSLLRVATNNTEQMIHRGSSSDQSLFSVFSQCSQLRPPITPFEPQSLTDQVVAYGMQMEGSTTQIGGNLAQPTNPLDYLSGSNTETSLIPGDEAWMNQSSQNSSLHDPLGNLYPRSWNP